MRCQAVSSRNIQLYVTIKLMVAQN